LTWSASNAGWIGGVRAGPGSTYRLPQGRDQTVRIGLEGLLQLLGGDLKIVIDRLLRAVVRQQRIDPPVS
jgi:hypothetical protein